MARPKNSTRPHTGGKENIDMDHNHEEQEEKEQDNKEEETHVETKEEESKVDDDPFNNLEEKKDNPEETAEEEEDVDDDDDGGDEQEEETVVVKKRGRKSPFNEDDVKILITMALCDVYDLNTEIKYSAIFKALNDARKKKGKVVFSDSDETRINKSLLNKWNLLRTGYNNLLKDIGRHKSYADDIEPDVDEKAKLLRSITLIDENDPDLTPQLKYLQDEYCRIYLEVKERDPNRKIKQFTTPLQKHAKKDGTSRITNASLSLIEMRSPAISSPRELRHPRVYSTTMTNGIPNNLPPDTPSSSLSTPTSTHQRKIPTKPSQSKKRRHTKTYSGSDDTDVDIEVEEEETDRKKTMVQVNPIKKIKMSIPPNHKITHPPHRTIHPSSDLSILTMTSASLQSAHDGFFNQSQRSLAEEKMLQQLSLELRRRLLNQVN